MTRQSRFSPLEMTTNVGLGPNPDAPTTLEGLDRLYERINENAEGRLIAWDPVAQREVWRADRAGPANGGALSTAGGLVFQGTGTGKLLALDAATGRQLWSSGTQTGVMAAPISYALDSTQYVAIVVGTGGSWAASSFVARDGGRKGNQLPNVSRVLVYALDATHELPEPSPVPVLELMPPPATAAEAIVEAGAGQYAAYCTNCHGPNAVNLGILPDLRYSSLLNSSEAWREVVLDGALADTGMAGFAPVLNAEQAEAIRAYVIEQANASMNQP